MRKITFSVVGLGSRGKDTYLPAIKSFPGDADIVAVADIDSAKVQAVKEAYGLAAENCYDSAEALLEAGRLSDVLVIATQDRQHVKQAIAAMRLGYDLILEKPISPDLKECVEIEQVAKETKRKVVVCHVLRYTPFYRTLKEILDRDEIGTAVSINAVENVGYWHQAHSFVRGNWRSSDETSPMILQKSSHDLDLYPWLTGKRYERVSSFGSTFLFRADKAPAGAAKRCLDGCKVKDLCPFDAEKIYVKNERTGIEHGHEGWPNNILSMRPTVKNIYEALKTGPYGRCVYYCDNNVVDHQVANFSMDDGSTMSFTMCAFNSKKSRMAQIMGTKGEIFADMSDNTINCAFWGRK